MTRIHRKVKLLVAILYITACAPSITPTQTIAEIIPATFTPTVIPTVTLVPTLTNTPVPDISTLSIDEMVELYVQGKIEYPTELADSVKAEFSTALVGYLNQQVGHSVHITKTFKDVDYDIYWSPVRNQWRSDHNTPLEELDLNGDSFPELIAVPEEFSFEPINLPVLGERSLAQIYQMSDAELKKYVIGLIQDAMRAKNPNVTAEKLKQIEEYYNGINFLPVIIDPNIEQNNLYSILLTSAQGRTATIPEAGVDFIEYYTNVVLMPITNEQSEIICFVRIHQKSVVSSSVTEFSSNGTLTTGGYDIEDPHAFGNTHGDSFGIIGYKGSPRNTPDSLLEGEEGIGDITTIQKLKKAETLEEVMEILKYIRIIVVENTDAVVERN